MIILKEIVHNHLMGYKFIQKWISKYHITGINQNEAKINEVYDFYTGHCSITDKSILEIGPGQTIEVLSKALQNQCLSVSAVDVTQYIEPATAKKLNIDYKVYDGKKLPFKDNSFDLIWSYDVFEHIRFPEITISEAMRVLKPDGVIISLIDLGDHFSYGKGDESKLFNCLKYSERIWNLMTWNRSNYVNRLRYNDWIVLHEKNGFEVIKKEGRINKVIEQLYKQGKINYLKKYEPTDAINSAITIVAKK